MRRVILPASPGKLAPRRVLLMPGAYQRPEDFITAGFATALQARGLDVDLEFIAPEFAHLLDRSVLDALHDEVILPVRADGCRELWLGGVSLGGFIALCYAERRLQGLDGLCLLAPYLGNRMVTGEVARAGGVQHWRPGPLAADDEERRVWSLIQRLHGGPLQLFVGLGRSDRFGHGHALLAGALPAAAVQFVEGGHDWPTWLRLWACFLDRLSGSAHAAAPDPAGVR
jgi:pimeloyl-ACP methyl ester carboxylesterase